MQIRTFEFERDLETVLDLWAKSEQGIHLGRSDEPQEILKKIKRDPDLFLIAEDEGSIIGAVMGGFDGRRGKIYHLAVDSHYRKKGIGRALMEELEQRLRSKGCLKYYLLVKEGNQEAMAFYKQMGCSVMDLYILGKELV